MKKIILVFMMALLLVLPIVSAAEFDNVKSYDEETKTITVTNLFGLGSVIARIQLGSPLDLRVPIGEEILVAWYDLENLQDYDGAEVFDIVETLDLRRGNAPIQKNIVFKKKQNDIIQVPIYETTCSLTGSFYGNGTEIEECSTTQTGTEEKEIEEWTTFNKEDLLGAENYTIGLFTEVEQGEKVEWIPTMYGVRIEEWAAWTADMNVGLIAYWKLDETTGTVAEDSIDGTHNLTVDDAWTTGKINNADLFDGTTGSDTNYNPTGTTELSFNFWIKDDGASPTGYLGGMNNAGDAANAAYFITFGGAVLQVPLYTSAGGQLDMTTSLDGTFKMITIIMENGNQSLYVDGVVEDTEGGTITSFSNLNVAMFDYKIGGGQNLNNAILDEIGMWNRSLTDAEVVILYNGGAGVQYTDVFNAISATLVSPDNLFNSSSKDITFNWTAETTETVIENSTLYIDGVINQTIIHGTSNSTDEQIILGFPDGDYNWSITVYDDGTYSDTTETRFFGVDATDPAISITYPTGNIADEFVTSPDKTIYLNWTISDTNLETCWYYNNTANVTVTCGVNATFTLPYGTYDHLVYANDTYGNENSDTQTITYSYELLQNSLTNNYTVYETNPETFSINVTKGSSYTDITAGTLWYNGTSYAGTETDDTTSSIFSYTLQTPLTVTANTPENNSVIWEIELDSSTYLNTSTSSQYVLPMNLSTCHADGIMNVTFQDQKSLTKINATTINVWDFYMGDGSIFRSNSYQNTTPQWEYYYCFEPDTKNVTITGTATHENPNYPQRQYNYAYSYNNDSIRNIIVYLLGSSDGIYTTFQVLSPAGDTIAGVTATVATIVGGSLLQIDAGTTGDDGGVTFWVNPDESHTFLFTKTGYDDTSISLTPTQSQYTVYMGGQAVNVSLSDYNRGIGFNIAPMTNELTNSTTYSFNYTLTSNYWNVNSFGYIIRNKTTTLGTSSASTNGGTINSSISTGTSEYIIMDYYWNVDGNYTNISRTWMVVSESKGFGLSNFFTHLKQYTDEEIFGLNAWSRTLIIFIFIFSIVGMASYYTGAYSPAAVSVLLFGLVALFDAVFGMIPSPVGAVDNFATIITFFMMGIILIWEAMK